MARTALPTIPAVILGVVEPLLLVWGSINVLLDPQNFYSEQVPAHPVAAADFQPQGLAATLQLGNIYSLLALLALICVWTPHPEVARRYCLAVAVADYGHIYATYKAVGPEYFWNFAGWNDTTIGNVGVSVALNVVRLATVAGVFGRIGGSGNGKVKSG